MSISLFKHNEEAYQSALSLLSETGKAAIIHPTGTGKSFIGFKLCEDNPDQIICWLSPSEYIFQTQLENLKRASEGYLPNNIVFFTYAKLMMMDKNELENLNLGYIVLDEFHRCGAEMWGKGVQNLLDVHPEAPIIGLSATNIRYLDNRRDMADELFEGNIASEMTLGEAIVRGILDAPKYVLSVFSYQKDLERYKSRIKRAKSRVVRDEAERYLEALRRTLEKADGLDEVFYKHMTDKTGKYIVFCSNINHLREMRAQGSKWFSKFEKPPKIYTVYSEDPSASKEFQRFKDDKDDNRLRLLYCIDALNEGIHVDNISGVILLRPTVSPIIYKQQIGRALSASKKKDAVIFDIVLNIENLYNIGAVEEEMKIAMTYYRSHGMSEEIINEQFRVIDEIKDCKELFEKLNDTLSTSWDLMYEKAEEYYKQNGDLKVPYRYKTKEGYALGSWILTQKRVRAGEQFGELGAERIKKLNDIEMIWESYRDLSWERNYAAAKEYYKSFGNLNVPIRYESDDGIKLGQWVSNLRSFKRNHTNRRYLNEERIKNLEQIGMIWDVSDFLWDQYYGSSVTYFHENGNLDIPISYVTGDGLRLGIWLNNIRSAYRNKTKYRLTDAQISALNEIGIVWDLKSERLWNKGFSEASKYKKINGDLNVPATYKTQSGYRLGAWVSRQRSNKASLALLQKHKLDALGMIWSKPDPWEERFAHAKDYYEKHGDLNIPAQYIVEGMWINKWLNEQRQIYLGNRKNKKLTSEQIYRLESIGMVWHKKEKVRKALWEEQFSEVKSYFEKYGNLNIPTNFLTSKGKRLDLWLIRQRQHFQEGKLSKEQIKKLSSINMIWEFDDPWEIGFKHAKAYFEKNGHLQVPSNYICEDRYSLGNWISNQRSNYLYPDEYRKVTKEQRIRLESIGMVWQPNEEAWEKAYELALDYYKAHKNLLVPSKYKTETGYGLGEWIRAQRNKYVAGTLSQEKIAKLNNIGMEWRSPNAAAWEQNFLSLEEYKRKHGDLEIPISFTDSNGFKLGLWLRRMRNSKDKLKTKGENGNQIERLESLGVVFKDDGDKG